jgi:hypothetical protein
LSATAAHPLVWGGSIVWIALWGVFVVRLVWLDSRLRAHVAAHHVHHWRRLTLTERLTWSTWFVFGSKEDYGDPGVAARRREMLTVFFDLVLVTAGAIVWFVIVAAVATGAS